MEDDLIIITCASVLPNNLLIPTTWFLICRSNLESCSVCQGLPKRKFQRMFFMPNLQTFIWWIHLSWYSAFPCGILCQGAGKERCGSLPGPSSPYVFYILGEGLWSCPCPVPEELLWVVSSLYNWSDRCVYVLGRKSSALPVAVGVCQGCAWAESPRTAEAWRVYSMVSGLHLVVLLISSVSTDKLFSWLWSSTDEGQHLQRHGSLLENWLPQVKQFKCLGILLTSERKMEPESASSNLDAVPDSWSWWRGIWPEGEAFEHSNPYLCSGVLGNDQKNEITGTSSQNEFLSQGDWAHT